MQADTMQEQMERVIPAWCTENGFGDDPVTVSTFTQLAVKLLSVLPQDLPMSQRMLTLQPDMLLADEHSFAYTVTDDFATRDQPTLASMGEGFAPDVLLRPGSPSSSPKTGPANTAYGQSPPAQPFPDTSGDWRVLFYDGDWWAAGHHMLHPARDESDARRLCQDFSRRA